MRTVTCQQRIRWMGVQMRVPASWQMVRHSLSPSRGQVALIDRYRQRMTLSWTQCRSEPDLQRMVEDYRSQQLEAHAGADITELRDMHDWVGTQRRFEQSGQRLTQAVHYDPATRRLIEASVTCLSTTAEDDALVEELLTGIEVVEPADAVTRWRAFDMDVTMPPPDEGERDGQGHWRLHAAQINPADATMTFLHVAPGRWNRMQPTGNEITVRRMGMAETWYDGDAERYLGRQFPKATIDPAGRHDGGRRVAEACGWDAGPPLKRMLGLLRRRHDLLWRCKPCNAVFHVSVRSVRKRRVEPDALTVRCEASHA